MQRCFCIHINYTHLEVLLFFTINWVGNLVLWNSWNTLSYYTTAYARKYPFLNTQQGGIQNSRRRSRCYIADTPPPHCRPSPRMICNGADKPLQTFPSCRASPYHINRYRFYLYIVILLVVILWKNHRPVKLNHARIQSGGPGVRTPPPPIPWDLSEVGSCVHIWWVGEGVQRLFLSYSYNFFLARSARHVLYIM